VCGHNDLDVCLEPTGILHTFAGGIGPENFTTSSSDIGVSLFVGANGTALLNEPVGPPEAWASSLISPQIDVSNAGSVHLQWFQSMNGSGTPGDAAKVQVSVDGGDNFIDVYSTDGATTATDEFLSIDISQLTAGATEVGIRFIWYGSANSSAHWSVHDVVVGAGAPPTLVDTVNLPGVINEGSTISDGVAVSDSDPGDSVFFSLSGAPSFITTSAEIPTPPSFTSTLTVAPQQGDSGSYNVILRATDEQNLRFVIPFTAVIAGSL